MERFSPYALPWSTPSLWQAANETIAHTILNCRDAHQSLVDLGGRIRERLVALDAPMTDLCRQTCIQCQDICCGHAHAYFDFKDLLYLHLSARPLPPMQTLGKTHRTCCYLGDKGCHLPRTERPFICTWYLCPQQRASLDTMAVSVKVFILNSLQALKSGRQQLQGGYLRATASLACAEYNL